MVVLFFACTTYPLAPLRGYRGTMLIHVQSDRCGFFWYPCVKLFRQNRYRWRMFNGWESGHAWVLVYPLDNSGAVSWQMMLLFFNGHAIIVSSWNRWLWVTCSVGRTVVRCLCIVITTFWSYFWGANPIRPIWPLKNSTASACSYTDITILGHFIATIILIGQKSSDRLVQPPLWLSMARYDRCNK